MMFKSRCRHNMIPLSVKIRTHAVSSCAQHAPWNSFQQPRFFISRNHDMPQAGSDYLPVLAKCENRDKYNAHR